MKKKNIFIILAILALISVVYVTVKVRQKEIVPTITPRRPDIPNYVTGKLPIEILIKKDEFVFPTQLPALSMIKRALSKESIVSFAANLGFSQELNETEDIDEGLKYYISTDTRFFVATPKTSIIKFGFSASELPVAINKNLADQELTKTSTEFLTKNGFYKEDQIKPSPVIYLKENPDIEGLEKTNRNSAELFRINFSFTSSEYEILTNYSAAPQIFVQILPDGTIYNAEILLIDNIQKGLTEYPLKTYEEVANGLDEARLIGLAGDYISPSDLTISDVVSLKVESIKLAYLLEQGKENFLQPIYLLEGPATIRNSSANFATIYMPAYK